MKTGKLLKFHRPGGEIQAYLYRDGALVHAAVYVSVKDRRGEPNHTVSGPSEAGVESDVRAWVDSHFPRSR